MEDDCRAAQSQENDVSAVTGKRNGEVEDMNRGVEKGKAALPALGMPRDVDLRHDVYSAEARIPAIDRCVQHSRPRHFESFAQFCERS